MRASASFTDLETAMLAHKALLEDGVEAENIEVRSSYPIFEEIIPPHRHRPMHIRNIVRFLWVCGAIGGFSLVSFAQLDYPIKTSGQNIVPIPIDAIITYECAQITALIMTAVFFFIETKTFRMRPIPQDEDFDVGTGEVALVVDGPRAENALPVLEKHGARIVRKFSSIALIFLMALMTMVNTGCTVRMRSQPAIKDTEQVHAAYPAGIYSMPSEKDPDIASLEEPFGRILSPLYVAATKKEGGAYPKSYTPASLKNIANPVPWTPTNAARGELLYKQNCQACHGEDGKGKGPIASLYAPPPADLTRKDLAAATDGDLYWTVTIGPSTMPQFGSKMPAMDRFAIVGYVRKLQGKEPAPAPEPPAAGQPDQAPPAGGGH